MSNSSKINEVLWTPSDAHTNTPESHYAVVSMSLARKILFLIAFGLP